MSTDLGPTLLKLARGAIAAALDGSPLPAADHPALKDPGATFVTLTEDGALRGCIGSLEAHRPLGEDVVANARASAFQDPRFPPLRAAELPRTRVEVSLLTPADPMDFADEADALAKLCPGIDGVIFECGRRRATFLPQVWEQLPLPQDFMAHLKVKAGFAASFWSPEVRLYRYRVRKWSEA